MKITNVKFYDINKNEDSKFLAKCSVVLDNCIMLHDIKVLNGKKGLYVVMPRKQNIQENIGNSKNNVSEDIFHPVSKVYFLYMSSVILSAYKDFIGK